MLPRERVAEINRLFNAFGGKEGALLVDGATGKGVGTGGEAEAGDESLDEALAAMEALYGDASEAEAEAEAEEEAEEEEETPAVDEDDEDLLPAAKRKEIDALFRSFGGKEGSLGSL